MKKVLFVLGLVLLSAVAFSQPISYTPFTASGYSFKYVRTDSGFAVPLRDTSVGRGTTRPGSIVCRPQDSLFYGWNGARWSLVNSDLSSVIALIDEKVDSVTVDGDSIFYWKLGVSYGYVFSTASWLLTGNNITSGQFLGSLTAEPLLMKINDSTMVFVSDTLVTLGDIYSSNTGTKIDINTRDSLVNIIADNLQIIGLASSSDTTTYKPIGLSSAGVTRRMSLWPGAGWGLTGNAGTTAGTNFVGTTDNIDLRFKRNSVTAGLIGSTNTFFGLSAGNIASISGTNNTGIGLNALAVTSSGGANVGIGAYAGKYNTTASNQIFINSIDRTNLSGDQTYSILFGQQTADASVLSSQILTVNGKLGINTISPAASAVVDISSTTRGLLIPRMTTTERNAIVSPVTGLQIFNSTLSALSVYSSTNTQWLNIGFGRNAAYGNTAVGVSTMEGNITGQQNTAVGINSLNQLVGGSSNTAVGSVAGYSIIAGSNNTAIGQATMANSDGSDNTAIGISALRFANGSYNNGIGAYCLRSSIGSYNCAQGHSALFTNTSGAGNTAVGHAALQANLTASYSTGIGYEALYLNTGTSNVAIGAYSLFTNSTGAYNLGLGFMSGKYGTTQSHRIYVGTYDNVNYTGDQTLSPIYIEDNNSRATNKTVINGNLAINTIAPQTNAALQVSSVSKGFMPPVMTTVERNAVTWVTGDAGMIIYNTTNNKHQGWDGSAWNDLY